MATADIPRWLCHKKVLADRVIGIMTNKGDVTWTLACGAEVAVGHELLHRGGPNPIGGYYVRYDDGYQSWSPAAAFEDGYTREQ